MPRPQTTTPWASHARRMDKRGRERRAFTLLEMLVVVGVVGVLLSLLLPAVQKVRAAAARTACVNNLKQIALAAQNYHDANGAFPPGINVSPNSRDPNPSFVASPPWSGPYTGSLAYLLPYLEQDNVYRELVQFDPGMFRHNSRSPAWAYGYGPFDFEDPGVPPSQENGTGGGYPKAVNADIRTFHCPADPGTIGAYVFDGLMWNYGPPVGYYLGYDWIINEPGYGREMGRTNYVGVMGAQGKVPPGDQGHAAWRPFTGIYYGNSRTRIADIKDGASNTLAFGEALGGLHVGGSRDMELSWMGAGCLATKYGLAPNYGPQGGDYMPLQFQSAHTGVVNFAFADGHVTGVSQTVDFDIFIYASGMADGQAYDVSTLND